MNQVRSMVFKPEMGVFLVLILLTGIFSILSPSFLAWDTWSGILVSSTEVGLIALGATILMISGEFDLSVGSNLAFSGMTYATLVAQWDIPGPLAIFPALIAGLLIGVLNGWLTLSLGLPSFISTLGTMLLWRGVVLMLTDGFPVSALTTGWAGEFLNCEVLPGFKGSLVIWAMIAGLLAFLLKHHRWGNWIMAVGGNEQASFAMGLKTRRIKMGCFMLTGFLAALAGVIQFEHLGSLSPTAGEQYELRAIAIAVIGGTLLTGGVGTVWGTLIGTILMSVLAAGLVQAGVSTYWFRSFLGVILVMAVVFNDKIRFILRQRRSAS